MGRAGGTVDPIPGHLLSCFMPQLCLCLSSSAALEVHPAPSPVLLWQFWQWQNLG